LKKLIFDCAGNGTSLSWNFIVYVFGLTKIQNQLPSSSFKIGHQTGDFQHKERKVVNN
jgi:hypothetical protein